MFCPHCENDKAQFEEVVVENDWDGRFAGIAVECPDCGARGMAAKQDDDKPEEIALHLWNCDYVEIVKLKAALSQSIPWKENVKEKRNVCMHCGQPFLHQDASVEKFHTKDCIWYKAWKAVNVAPEPKEGSEENGT